VGRVSCCGKTNASGGGGRGFWWGSLVQLLQLEKESWAGSVRTRESKTRRQEYIAVGL
jgi:hypothetical protein